MKELHSQWRVPITIEVKGEMVVTAKDLQNAKMLVQEQPPSQILGLYLRRERFKKVVGTPEKL